MASSRLLLLLMLLLLLIRPPSTAAQSYRNLTLGLALSPLGRNSSWLSPSGDFAFGFRPLETDPTLFLLAVWFDKTPNKTIVWYANGDRPLPAGSTAALTPDGNLSLKDPAGGDVWNATVSTASYAAVLDTGNLVLVGSDGKTRWQSFGSPTDTILPTQSLGQGTRLWSRLMDTDYSNGRFQLDVQGDGNVVLYLVALPTGNNYNAYWASNTVGNGTQLVFNNSGVILLVLKNGTNFQFTSGSTDSVQDFYHRGTLDPDGVFRHYVYPKIGGGGWMAVDLMPPSICQVVNSQTGSGVCGFNSYCQSGGTANQRVNCECPPQYSFFDPTREYKGCKPDFAAPSCDDDVSSAAAMFDFSEVANLDWPFADYEMYNPIEKDQCRNQCLSDCFCAVAIYNGGYCWKKKLPLSNGRMGSFVQRVALIKVPKSNSSQVPALYGEKGGLRGAWLVLGSSFLAGSVFLNLLLTAAIVMATTNWNKRMRKLRPAESLPGLNLRCFTYKELETATNGFREELGCGSFGRVYKGYIQSELKSCVAVKKLDRLLQETEKEFMAEIQSIGQTHHKNLARLLGFCKEGTERLLVYEFMSNGSLTSFLFGDIRPDWNQRIQIALGITRGLLYLHEECSTQIIHCDIKPQNILLDDDFVARISDFGLAKLLMADQTRTNTGIRGTRGYVAPEWFKNSAITAKVDVYSYGVMLLEIICCRRNVEPKAWKEEEVILAFWAYDCYRDGRMRLLVEGDEEAVADIARVERFVAVAIWCIQEEPSLRPSMLRVTQMLDGAIPVPVAPDPSP